MLNRTWIPCLLGTAVTMALVGSAAAAEKKVPAKELHGLPLLFHDDFDADVTDRWERTDASAWEYKTADGNSVVHLTKNSAYRAKVRSPNSIAWINDLVVGDFILEARLKSLGQPDDGHRDLCLFWGGTDPSHFYYVHMGKKADPHSNAIFLVNGAPRVSIAKTTTTGTPWDEKYHRVWIVRTVASGKIEVFFDDRTTPVMTAEDKTFTAGRIGIGSFDNTGYFDSITIWGKKAKPGTPTVTSTDNTHPHVVLSTTQGDITIELDAEKAPLTVANFLQYVDDGHFDGTIFHRVMSNFMIQGGGFTPDMKKKTTRDGVKNEWQNGLKNARGTISMARLGGQPDSGTAQFFINVVNNASLDRPQPDGAAYAVFGKVTEGMDVVDAIRKVRTHTVGGHANVPVEPIVIQTVRRAP